jgi:hypothetical protein
MRWLWNCALCLLNKTSAAKNNPCTRASIPIRMGVFSIFPRSITSRAVSGLKIPRVSSNKMVRLRSHAHNVIRHRPMARHIKNAPVSLFPLKSMSPKAKKHVDKIITAIFKLIWEQLGISTLNGSLGKLLCSVLDSIPLLRFSFNSGQETNSPRNLGSLRPEDLAPTAD